MTLVNLSLGGLIVMYFRAPQALKEAIGRIKPRKKPTIGTVNRPSAEKVNKRGDVIEEKLEEGQEEFAKILRKVGIKPEEP